MRLLHRMEHCLHSFACGRSKYHHRTRAESILIAIEKVCVGRMRLLHRMEHCLHSFACGRSLDLFACMWPFPRVYRVGKVQEADRVVIYCRNDPKITGTVLGNKNCSILRSILGPHIWKLPCVVEGYTQRRLPSSDRHSLTWTLQWKPTFRIRASRSTMGISEVRKGFGLRLERLRCL